MLFFLVIIAIPTFFILYRVSKQPIKNYNNRIIATCIGTIILTPLLYIASIFIFFTILFKEPTRKFDSVSWNSERKHRFEMADNIINTKMLIGKDTAQLKALLGNTLTKNNDSWTYDIGQGVAGLGFRFHWLSVKFQENKIVLVKRFHYTD